MATNPHVEMELELRNLESTIGRITNKIAALQQLCDKRKATILEFRKQFWADITIDLNDLLETYASISQQSMLLNSEEKNYLHALKQLEELQRIAASPYFGRFDFSEHDSDPPINVYIGKFGVVDDDTGQFLVYDWRSPIAGLFYDYGIGPASYEAPAGVIRGIVSLKRQYLIQDGDLRQMFETDVHIRDEMLLAMLSRGADDKLRSIAATIQREQNAIIRDERHRLLLVQGAAGSGKTTAALHRIAYLLYKYRGSLSAEQFLLFTPNPIFADYISNVLPDLGESNVRQTTLQEYKRELLGETWSVEAPYEQLERMLEIEHEAELLRMESAIRFKTSSAFREIIDRYVERLGREGMLFLEVRAEGRRLLSRPRLQELFYGEWSKHPIPRRLSLIEAYAEKLLAKLSGTIMRERLAETVKSPGYWENDGKLRKMCAEEAAIRLAPVKALLRERGFVDYKRLYMRLFQEEALFGDLAAGIRLPPEWKAICGDTIASMENGNLHVEDSTPFLYLKAMLGGLPPTKSVKHVVIDEAQDYSGFDYRWLERMFPNSKMTLLGDISQSIYAHVPVQLGGTELLADGGREAGVVRLDKSYRSTMEIVAFTSSLLPQNDSIRPFGRNGRKPEWIVLADRSEVSLRAHIAADCDRLLRDNMQSIAVICRSAKECEQVYSLLRPHMPDIRQLAKETRSYEGTCFVAPVYFAKGLEFDGVIVPDISRYRGESEIGLLYTACTRALHRLIVYASPDGCAHPFMKPDPMLVDPVYRQ